MAMTFLQGDGHGMSREVIEIQACFRRAHDLVHRRVRGARREARGRRRDVESEVVYIDPGMRAERHPTFDHMGEFTHVTWPVILLQTAQGLRRQVPRFEVVGRRMALEKGLRQQGNIIAVFAQGGTCTTMTFKR